jgi:hypothetical protein
MRLSAFYEVFFAKMLAYFTKVSFFSSISISSGLYLAKKTISPTSISLIGVTTPVSPIFPGQIANTFPNPGLSFPESIRKTPPALRVSSSIVSTST